MSKLINKTRLEQFATGLWTKIKGKYDEAFKGAEISPSNEREKHITFKRISEENPLKVSLEDYARLQDKNNFKQDVTVNNADYISTLTIGNENGPVTAANRTTGYRRLTNKSFTDGYVSHLRVYVPTGTTAQRTQAHAWVIKKGERKSADTLFKIIGGQQVDIVESGSKKYFDIPINEAFNHEVFFVIRTANGQNIVGINNIQSSLRDDAINISDSFNPRESDIGNPINWGNYDQRDNEIGYMELHGRTGIVDINKKLKEIEGASGTYVKHSDCTDGTGDGTKAGKVVKLGTDGKLSESMLPAIALNEFLTATAPTWDAQAVASLKFQNGDVIFHQATQKRYLCVNKDATSFNDRFVELNAKDGVVTAVNGQTGAVTLSVVEEGDVVKIKANDTVVGTINAITEDEINTIIQNLS